MIPKEALSFIDGMMGRSPRTKLAYESFANVLWEYLGNKSIAEITVDDVMAFLKDGMEKRNWKPTTVNHYARLCCSFLSEFKDNAFMKKLKKRMRFLPRTTQHASLYEGLYVPPNKIDEFVRHAPDEEWGVFYTMIFKWGLRLSEALSFTPADIDVPSSRIAVRGKGAGGMGKTRLVYVEPQTLVHVMKFAGCSDDEMSGKKVIRDTTPIIKNIKTRNAEYKFKQTAREIGLKNWQKLHLHSARHSYAIDFLVKRKNQGMMALVLLKNQLGHTSITVTSIYLDIAGGEAKDVFDAGVQSSNTKNMLNTSGEVS